MRRLFSQPKKKTLFEEPNMVITVVSGLPRSGTSMVMKMLEAGGMPIITDNIRKPDEDNPKGYYEFEKVKKIKEDTSWLEYCHGKAVKMVSALLYYLPEDRKYNVIFLLREMDEMLASQKIMLKRLGQWKDDTSDEDVAELYNKHLKEVGNFLKKSLHISSIYVKYNDIIVNPTECSEILNSFLGRALDVEKMASAVDKYLYRQRHTRTRTMTNKLSA